MAIVIPLHDADALACEIEAVQRRLREIDMHRMARWHDESGPLRSKSTAIENRIVREGFRVRSGPRKGEPLTERGIRNLLRDFARLERELERSCERERRLCSEKDSLEVRLAMLRLRARRRADRRASMGD